MNIVRSTRIFWDVDVDPTEPMCSARDKLVTEFNSTLVRPHCIFMKRTGVHAALFDDLKAAGLPMYRKQGAEELFS